MTTAEQLREEGREQGREEAREQGRREGRKQGLRESLIRLLTGRFGQLPEPVLARIRRAELTLLDRWFEQGITAASVEAVFADEP
jgi:predicted transposase YdaD